MPEFRVIQSVQRAVNIINCFSDSDYYLSLNEISKRLSLNINTTRGLVQTLVSNNILIHDEQRNLYCLGYFFIIKSKLVTNNLSTIIDAAKPYLFELAHRFTMTCSLQIAQGSTIQTVYYERPSDLFYRITGVKYMPLPYHASSSGKLLMAFSLLSSYSEITKDLKYEKYTDKTITTEAAYLEEIKKIQRLGYATENGEFEPSIYSLAVPLFDNGRLFATISFIGITGEVYPQEDELVTHLMRAKTEIENKICRLN